MSEKLTWPIAAVLLLVIAAIAYMYGETTDAMLQERILGYFERVLTFVIGAGTGGAIAGAASYTLGFRKGKAAPH